MILNIFELAEHFCVTKKTIYSWIKKGMPIRRENYDLFAVQEWYEKNSKYVCVCCGSKFKAKKIFPKINTCKDCKKKNAEEKRKNFEEFKKIRKDERKKACLNCQASFSFTDNRQKFCSYGCARDFKGKLSRERNTKRCLTCNGLFVGDTSRKFCSPLCSSNNQKGKIKAPRATVVCSYCDENFEKRLYEITEKNFCSSGCHRSFQKEGKIKNRKENPKKIIYRKAASLIRSRVIFNFQPEKYSEKFFLFFGYTPTELRARLEKNFKRGMNWDNYGLWHIDHVIPLNLFNYEKTSDFDFKRAWSLKNMQPLWRRENLVKSDKYEKPFQPGLIHD